MFSVEVTDQVMIAHSFEGEIFGPARRLHGATFVVKVAFFARGLTVNNIVIDIGRARSSLREILQPLDYMNLDVLSQFSGQQTTTEYVAYYLFERLVEALKHQKLGEGSEAICKMRVMILESPVAMACYECDVDVAH